MNQEKTHEKESDDIVVIKPGSLVTPADRESEAELPPVQGQGRLSDTNPEDHAPSDSRDPNELNDIISSRGKVNTDDSPAGDS